MKSGPFRFDPASAAGFGEMLIRRRIDAPGDGWCAAPGIAVRPWSSGW